AYAIGKLGPQNARDAFARIDRPEIEAFVVPGGNFPTMPSIAAWEREFGKPVVTTNQASIWAMLRAFDSADRLPAFGRLLAEVPADASYSPGMLGTAKILDIGTYLSQRFASQRRGASTQGTRGSSHGS